MNSKGGFLIPKRYLEQNVYDAAIERTEYLFDEFERVYFSFSGGKDSSVMMHLALKIAKEKGRLPVHALFVDLEGNYQMTIDHIEDFFSKKEIVPYWVCLPIHLRNSVSMFQPQWMAWDPKEKINWIREIPKHDYVISDVNYFPFYRFGMEFEEFVVEFGEWFAQGKKTACVVAIRSDESLNRYRTIVNKKKIRYNRKGWTTKISPKVYNSYPIYDWKTQDIWVAVGKFGWSYNKLYDAMYLQGRTIHQMRICQPYGDDQRKGLDLFHECEPETWFKVVNRVSGANMGSIYREDPLLGNRQPILPEGQTWKSYVDLLLKSLPRYTAEKYLQHFIVFRDWYADHGLPIEEWPDKGDSKLEAKKKIPSWYRLAKCILKNDYLCKSLSFNQTKNQFEKYGKLYEKYKEDDVRNEFAQFASEGN